MKRLLALLSVFIVAISFAFAQTKMIAHRSHSGSTMTVTLGSVDNFGLPSSKEIFVQDTMTREKLWVRITDWGSDSAAAARSGYKLLPDSGIYRPHWDSIRWMQESAREVQKRNEIDPLTK